MLRLRLTLLLAVLSSNSWADMAHCTIEIEDVNAHTKFNIEHAFTFKPGSSGLETQRKHFALPGVQYLCTLAFVDLDSGTALSCEKREDRGHSFVQSDRSAIAEHVAKNNLSFRDGSAFFDLSATCK